MATGPGLDKACPSDRAALSAAQYAAEHHHADADFYVRVVGQPKPLWVVRRAGRVVTTVAALLMAGPGIKSW